MSGGYSKKLALRLDAAQYAAYEGTPPTRPHWTAARAALVAVSAVLVVLVAGLAVLGGWLVVRDFPSFSILAGIPVLMIAWVLRPRLWSADDVWHELRRDDAPAFFALLDRIAAAAGAPMPDRVALDADFNASAATHGWLRRRTLTMGLPLFGVLTPQQRVAVLAHEFGHFVNGDPARSLLTQPAVRTPLILADLVRPSDTAISANLWEQLAERALWPLQVVLQRLFPLIGTGVVAVAARDHQRAEYCADALAVRLAGTQAVVSAMTDMAAGEQLLATIAAAERGTQSNPRHGRSQPPRCGTMAGSGGRVAGDDERGRRAGEVRRGRLALARPPASRAAGADRRVLAVHLAVGRAQRGGLGSDRRRAAPVLRAGG
ncbi:M48 family metallopeptidase [Lentzea sp. NPDC051838]|uniref:M48 family metallopeptidase n=1 Tax=Lentzea sp. NPDC051838 TaxID=3154849 RepID=UPI00342B53DC